MEQSPFKRRKTSPTTSVPVNAPATPSRIPVAKPGAQHLSASRPSYASPTKASISRHHPQLLNRPGSSSKGAGKSVDDLFAKALRDKQGNTQGQSTDSGEHRPNGDTRSGSTTQENEPDTQTIMDSQRRLEGGMAQKPRRMSRSPAKSPAKKANAISGPMWDSETEANPFGKKGLRRTPPLSSQVEAVLEEGLNPFKKTGLRRSPVGTATSTAQSQGDIAVAEELSNTPTAPPPKPAIVEDVGRRSALRRSPIGQSQPGDNLAGDNAQSTEGIAASKSAGLRRSPIGSQPVENTQKYDLQIEDQPTIPRRGGLRRSPVASSQSVVGSQVRGLPNVEAPSSSTRSGLRRSPIEPMRVDDSQFERLSAQRRPEVSTTSAERPSTPVNEVVKDSQSQQLLTRSLKRAFEPTRTGSPAMLPTKPKAGHHEEPELPPTPKQRGIDDPVVTTPPSGIHNTPSKRARRSKALGEKLKSSPLKPRAAPPPSPNRLAIQEAAKELVGILKKPVVETETAQPSRSKQVPQRRKSARFLIPEDPHAAKKKERDALLQQLQQLQVDIALANAENERLRLRAEAEGKSRGPATAPNQAEVIEMLRRATAPAQSSIPKEKPSSIFKSISAFLPFSSKRRLGSQIQAMVEEPPPSHQPLTLDDPLPHLQAFTPLIWSSTITLHPSSTQTQSASSNTSNPDHVTLQKHVLTASHPHGFFSSRLSLNVHVPSLTIQDITILRLPMCAEHELGSFIRPKARAEGALGGNVGVITWAMGRWCEVSIKRAGFWCALESGLGTTEARQRTFQSMRKGKRKRGISVVDAEDDQEQLPDGSDASKASKWSRKQLLPNLGRSSMEISNDKVELRFEWRLSFDWTGEVESTLGVTAGMPQTWHDQDERSSLAKIPEMFDRLVTEKGPLGAAKVVVNLLMGAT